VIARSHPRVQQFAVAATAVTQIAAVATLGTVMAIYIDRQATPILVTLSFVAFSLGLTVFAPIWGAIADATGRRRTVLVGTAVLAGLALLPLSIDQGVWTQIGVRGLYAVFFAGYSPVMLAIVSERGGDAAGRGRSIGFYNSATSVGGISGRLLSGFVLGLLAPGDVYLLLGMIALGAAGVATLVEDPTPAPDGRPARAELAGETRRRLLPAVDERDHLRTNGLGWLYVALVFRNVTVKGIGAVVPVYLVSVAGFSEVAMGTLLAVSPALRTVVMYVAGRVADGIGRKPLIVGGIAGAGLQALVLVAVLLVEPGPGRIAVAALAFVVHAFSFSALATGTIAFIGDVAPPRRESELMGLRTTVRGLGGVLGALGVGVVATVLDYPTAVLAVGVLAFGAAALVAVTLIESHEPAGGAVVPGD
jgi:MFS family permease